MRALTSLIATLCAFAVSPAIAQTQPASTTIDATATLKDAPLAPLALKVVQPLQFGTVVIPSKLRAGTICQYVVEALLDADATTTSVTERNAGGTSVPITSGCAFEGTQRTAQVEMTCQSSHTINVKVAYKSAAIQGAAFKSLSMAGRYQPGLVTSDDLTGGIPFSGTFPCRPSAGNNTVLLVLSGQLDVTNVDALTRNAKLSVGTISLDVSY